ncbi:hypothetical protein HB837_15380 [Listeria innocua]|uniref:hypothetical protein n=1 Tax=Listeria innocua TaxID=1642 RepID=UPI00162441E5|nr:hypothetical protein [Listeria innocua]MBC1353792.1 hypothetical protein [Listeria innocua]
MDRSSAQALGFIRKLHATEEYSFLKGENIEKGDILTAEIKKLCHDRGISYESANRALLDVDKQLYQEMIRNDINEKTDLVAEIKKLCCKYDLTYAAINGALFEANRNLYNEMLRSYTPKKMN